MAHFNSKTSWVQLNSFLDLRLTHICTAVFDYHITTTFPANIMVLVLNDDGKGNDYFEIPSLKRKMPLLKNHIYFIPCGLPMKIDITPGITTLAFHFSLTFFQGLDIFSDTKKCIMRDDPELVNKLRSVIEEKNELKAICELKAEVMNFCVSCWPENLHQLSPSVRKYEPIFRYVREHGTAELNVKNLADFAGQRQDVFSRAFSKNIGRSPKKFLQDDLLQKITARLLIPESSVKETAAELRFNSEFYMSRFFKKHTGISPSEYQNKFRK